MDIMPSVLQQSSGYRDPSQAENNNHSLTEVRFLIKYEMQTRPNHRRI